MTWTCGISIMTGIDPAKLDRAYDAIDSLLSPEAGAYEIETFGYGHANRKAYALVDEAMLADRGLTRNPEDRLNSGIFQEPIGNEPELQTMFEEIKSGA